MGSSSFVVFFFGLFSQIPTKIDVKKIKRIKYGIEKISRKLTKKNRTADDATTTASAI